MANIKITELNAAGSLAADDVLPVVDISTDETKKITSTNLFRTLPDGTAAAPALAFSSDQANGIYLAGTDTVGITTGGTQRVTVDASGNVVISGDLTVEGATTTVESTTVTIDDKNIELGSVASPSNTTADGGGITLKGASDKTIKWINSTGCWTFNQPTNFNDHVRITSDGKLGVGISSPTNSLHVKSSSAGTAAVFESTSGTTYLKLANSSNALGYIAYGSTNLGFWTNNSEKMRVDGSGRLLVGTTTVGHSDADNLTIADSSKAGITIRNTTTTGDGAIFFSDATSGTAEYAGYIEYGHSTNHLRFATSSVERMRIDSSGRLLVGTSSAENLNNAGGGSARQAKAYIFNKPGDNTERYSLGIITGINSAIGPVLSLAKTRAATNTHTVVQNNDQLGELRFQGSDGTNYIQGADISGFVDGTPGTNDMPGRLVFSTTADSASSPTERMRIDSSGRVGIGLTPTAPLHVNGTIQSQTGSSVAQMYTDGGSANFASVGAYPAIFRTNGAERMRIDSSGNLGLGTSAPVGKAYISGPNVSTFGVAADAALNLAAANGALVNRVVNLNFACVDSATNAVAAVGMKYTSQSGFGKGDLIFGTRSVTTDTAPTERMRIGSSGAVRIGDGSVAAVGVGDGPTLSITGSAPEITLRDSATNNPYAWIATNDHGDLTLAADQGNNASGSDINFRVDGSERMRLDASGRLLVGLSSSVDGSNTQINFSATLNRGSNATAADANIGVLKFADLRSNSAYGEIRCQSDGTPGTNDYPGRIVLATTADGASSPTERLRITSTGAFAIEGASNYGSSGQVLTSNGNDAPTWQTVGAASVGGANAISMNDNVKINFGASNDLQIYHDGSNSYVKDSGTGSLKIQGTNLHIESAAGEAFVMCTADGDVELYHNNSKKLETTSTGIAITGGFTTSGGSAFNSTISFNADASFYGASNHIFFDRSESAFEFQDNAKATFGTGNDLQIYHDGSHSYINQSGTGNLFITHGSETMIYAEGDGQVQLRFNNSPKLATKSDGVDVTGEVQCDSLDVDGAADFTGDATFRGGANAVLIKANSDIRFENGNWTGNSCKIQHHNNILYISGGTGGIAFREDGSDRCHIDGSGNFNPSSSNTYDLGSNSLRWRNVYTNDLNLSNEGSTNDVDGTWGDYTIQEGEDDLFLINRRSGKKYKFNLTEVS